MSLRIKLFGAPELASSFKKAAKHAETALAAGLYAVEEAVINLAKKNAPVDTGTLRGTGYATIPKVTGGSVAGEAGFGGPAKAYALFQHENNRRGHAKYLERAISVVKPTALRIASAQASRALARMATTVAAEGGLLTNPNDAPTRSQPSGSRKRRGRR